MASAEITKAPRWRATLAGLIDASIAAYLAWSLRAELRRPAARTLVAPSGELVREQLASPGQRLLGIRTVDARTGRRVELWRTLLLVAAKAGGQLAVARLAPPAVSPEGKRTREAALAEIERARSRHDGDPAALQAELTAIYERHRVPVLPGLPRAMAPSIAVVVINHRLRKLLAPTVEVRA